MCILRAAFYAFVVAGLTGCSASPSSAPDQKGPGGGTPPAGGSTTPVPAPTPVVSSAGEPKPVAAPAGLVGKWRLEVKEGASSRVSAYHFQKDGTLEIASRIDTPKLKTSDTVQAVITKVDGDKVTVVDLSHTSGDGAIDPVPAARQRPKVYQFKVTGDEVSWVRLDDKGQPGPNSAVLKRVKE
jgi:hypothetical protein